LKQESSIKDAEIAMVLKAMKKKFNKYRNKSYVLLCVKVIFDPRYKLKFIDFIFSQSFGTKAKQRFDRVESLVRELFQAYSSKGKESDLPSMSHLGSTDHKVPSMKTDPWAAWDRQLTHELQSQMTTELDRYLDETAYAARIRIRILVSVSEGYRYANTVIF